MVGETFARLRWATAHFVISAAIVGGMVVAIILLWYPPPLAALQGLTGILLILVLADIVLGPFCTFLIASPKKSRSEVRRDVAFVAVVQFAALAYGVHTVWAARPAYIVFNKDRFDVVTAAELEHEYFGKRTEGEFASPPFGRPRWVHALPPASLEERNHILLSATTGGPDLRHFPALYHSWPQEVEDVRARLKPLESLSAASQENSVAVSSFLSRTGLQPSQVGYLPLMGRNHVGVVLLKKHDLAVVESLDLTPDY